VRASCAGIAARTPIPGCDLVPIMGGRAVLNGACRLREGSPKPEARLHSKGGCIMKHLNPALERLEERIAPDLVGGISIGISIGDDDDHDHHHHDHDDD
jgi:hypothetical protein